MALWDDTELTISPSQTKWNAEILEGVIQWYIQTHGGHLPMAIRMPPRHWGVIAPGLKDNCERKHGVPILPTGGFQNEDEREVAWTP